VLVSVGSRVEKIEVTTIRKEGTMYEMSCSYTIGFSTKVLIEWQENDAVITMLFTLFKPLSDSLVRDRDVTSHHFQYFILYFNGRFS
jgi:hypothetical protein